LVCADLDRTGASVGVKAVDEKGPALDAGGDEVARRRADELKANRLTRGNIRLQREHAVGAGVAGVTHPRIRRDRVEELPCVGIGRSIRRERRAVLGRVIREVGAVGGPVAGHVQ
jgi:hypothetical protein